jgi:hypothetical protein
LGGGIAADSKEPWDILSGLQQFIPNFLTEWALVLITICIALGIISSFCESLPTADDMGDPVPETGNIRFPWIEQDRQKQLPEVVKKLLDLRTAKFLSNMHISE